MYIRKLSFEFCRKSNQLFYYPNIYLCARARDLFFYRKSIQLFYIVKKKIEYFFCSRLVGITNTPATTQPMSIQNTIAELIQKHEIFCVRTLADKYGFDPLEAMASLPRSGPVAEAPLTKKAAVAARKVAREAKKVAKADKPKRAPTGYLMFCQAERPSVKTENPDMKPQEIIRELGRRWKNHLSDDERDAWNECARSEATVVGVPVADSDSELDLEENDD